MAPEDGWIEEKDEPSRLDEIVWRSGEPQTPDLLYDPLEAEPVPPTRPRPDPADGSSLLFRLALSIAGLLVLLVLARGLWQPAAKPRPSAPERIARPAPPPVPIAEPRPEPVEEPVLKEEPAEQEPAELPPPQSQAPEPAVAEAAPAPVSAEPATPLPAPAVPEQARRLPPPWEEGPQPPDLLKPGPGVEEPVPMEFPRYSYPAAAQGTGLQVDVRLAVLVDERGRVIEARVREGAPPDLGFAETALAVAKRIPFQPATRYDIPGKMWTEVILEFVE